MMGFLLWFKNKAEEIRKEREVSRLTTQLSDADPDARRMAELVGTL